MFSKLGRAIRPKQTKQTDQSDEIDNLMSNLDQLAKGLTHSGWTAKVWQYADETYGFFVFDPNNGRWGMSTGNPSVVKPYLVATRNELPEQIRRRIAECQKCSHKALDHTVEYDDLGNPIQ